MRRLKNNITISAIIVSALAADLCFCSPVFAQSDEAKEFNRKGLTALEAGRHGEAVQLLKKAMELEPKWGEPCFNAARLLRLVGKREDMTKMLRKANGVEPSNPTYAEEYLKVLNEDLDKAEKEANNDEITRLQDEIIRVNPGDLKVGLKLIEKHIKLEENDEAYAAAQDLIERNSRHRSQYDVKEMGKLYYHAAKMAFERGELRNAKSYCDNARKFNFDKKKEAEEFLKEIKANVDNRVNGILEEATEAQKSGNHEKAMSLLKEAEEIQPDNEAIKTAFVQFADDEDINKFITKAKGFNANDRWLDAREVLLKLQEKYPENPQAKKMLADLAPKEASLLKAIGMPDIPTTAEERKGVLLGFKNSGIEFFENKNYKSCVSQLNKALALIAEDKTLNSHKSEIDELLKKIDEMDRDKANWMKAVDARNSGEYEDVIKLLKSLPADYDIQLDSYLAEAYYKTGDTEKAEQYGLKQLGKQPENNRAKFVLGCVYLDANDNERAYKYFTEVYDSDPEYPEIGDKLAASSAKHAPMAFAVIILVLLAWIAWKMKKNLPIYTKNSMISKAKSYFKKEDWDTCLEELQKVRHSAYLNNADTFEIAKLSAQCYLKKGRYDLAVGECKHLISLSPKSEEAHLWLGYAYLGRRMLAPEALPELLNLYKKESRNIALVSLLGSYYAQQKNLTDEGVAVLEQWLNIDHDNVEVLKPLGKYYLKKNRSDDKAMKVFQKMMEIGSPEPDFKLGVANVYLRTRQFDDCLRLCEDVINEDINNEYVHAIMLEAYKKQNRLSELLDIYANFLQNNPYNVAFQNGLKAAQAAYDKIQSKNATQAAAEAEAVMEKMMAEAQDESVASVEEMENILEPGQIPCPSCGKANPEGSYCCQYCGANMIQ